MWHSACWAMIWLAALWPLPVFGPWLWDRYKKKDYRTHAGFILYVCYSLLILAAILLHYNLLGPEIRVSTGRRFPLNTLERWLLVGLFFSVSAIFRTRLHPSNWVRSWRGGRYRI